MSPSCFLKSRNFPVQSTRCGWALAGEDAAESLTGQFHKKFSEQFDLVINGTGLDELKKYPLELVSRGIAAGEIPDEMFFGHYLFCIKDPNGNGITIYTSHAI
jgi:hypothetical protein